MYYFYYIIHPRNPAKLITGRCFAPSSFPTLRVLLLDNEKMWHSICSPRIKLDFRFEPKHFRSLTGLCYLLTPWCRVLLEKLTGLQLVKKFPVFYGNRRFITALTSIRQLSLSWASPIKSTYPHPTSWRSILILFNRLGLGLPSGLYSFGFPTKTLYTPSPHPYAPHAQPISFFWILSPAQYWVRSTDHVAPRYAISSIPPLPRPPRSKYSPQHPILKHPQLPFLPQCQRPSFTPIQNNRRFTRTGRLPLS